MQMAAARCKEDGWADQRPTGVQEQGAQLQVGEADVGRLSVSPNPTDFDTHRKKRSYEMSWFPNHQPLEKDYNSSSTNHHWPWLVCLHPSLFDLLLLKGVQSSQKRR